MEEFKISREGNKVIVNRPPQDQEELNMLRIAIQDAAVRDWLEHTDRITYKEV